MPKVENIAAYLETKVPSSLKLDFDNVGLLCGWPEGSVSRALVALDVTVPVIEEALELGAELIVSHHPVIFPPMKTILSTDAVGNRVIRLLRGGISVISLHTNLDIAEGGVNDALCRALGGTAVAPLPCGRICELPEEMPMSVFVPKVRDVLRVSGLRYHDALRPVRRIALCGGSGGDLVYQARELGCDTVLTGELHYHQSLDGKEQGLNLIDADHFCTENVVVPVLADLLHQGFPELEIHIARRTGQVLQGL